MSIIGEALLSATINALFDKLTSTDLLQFARLEQVHADLRKWEKILRQTYKVLDDAEERQITDRFVKDWLHELRDLAYDVEDILDEFATESLRRKLLDKSQASPSKLRKLIPVCCSSLNPESIKFNVKMGSELKEIYYRFEKIIEQKNNLDLKDNLGVKSYKVRYQRIPATSLHDTHVYGRESDKEAILDMLLKDGGGHVGVPVISITGMGGMGKTTLAQLVYNDVKVKNHFDIKSWACIAEDFEIARVTKAVLQSIAPETSDVNDLNTLQVELRERLDDKKSLIILDDVWHENYEEWTILCRPFDACSPGSKIVITTRNNSVASMVGTHSTYQLKELSQDNCLSIFTYHSLGKMDFSEHQDLKEIGEKIVKRCKGLPLAVKTLGGLLRGKVRSKDWEDVLNCKIWTLPEEKSGIIAALRVSYYYLPPHLKRCFAYCSIFPKDYIFEMNEMILLWMAECFLQIDSSEKEAEDTGKDFFEELYSRSFFQQYSSDSSTFVMHDLINDLAQWAAEDFCLRIEYHFEGEKQLKVPKNVHHLSYINGGSNYECMETFENFNEMKSIRTLLVCMPYFSARDFFNMLPQLRRLRVLSLKGYSITELPNTVGDLKQLRYLDLSYTKIENLPNSINKLYNLETLILIECSCLKQLCSDIGNLINLRHLYISDAWSLEGMPLGIGRLNCLRTLSVYVLNNDVRIRLKDLKNLTCLQGKLCISGLENVNDVEDAKKADCIGKKNLRELELKWTPSFGYSRNFDMETQVLDMLRPCQQLERLTILSYGGTKFPSWLGNTSSSLVLLTLENCKNCTSLPPLGQLPFLKDLFIRRLDGIKSIGLEFYGNGCSTPFQSLENLCIEDMQKWKEWIHLGKDSPRLQRPSFENCPHQMGNLPEFFPSLKSLCIRRCEQLQMFVASFPKHCEIEISECKEVSWSPRDCNSLSSVVLSDISGCVFLVEKFLRGSLKVVRAVNVEHKKLKCFQQIGANSLEDIGNFLGREFGQNMSFMCEEWEEHEQGLACGLQYLAVTNCDCLMQLPQVLHSLSFPRGLSIQDCPDLTSIPDYALPSELKFIGIKKCNALVSLPKSWMQTSNTSLEKLRIEECDSLTYIARVQLPPNLKKLEIDNCCGLRTLVDKEEVSISHEKNVKGGSCENNFAHKYSKTASCQSRGNLSKALVYLYVRKCPKLESIAGSFHGNKSLETIHIFNCKNLELLPNDLHTLNYLQEIYIIGCQSLVQYPEWQLPFANLKDLCILNCEKLDTLPSGMNNLTALHSVTVLNCPGIVCFPEDGFPTNIKSLRINIDVKICKSLFEWGLHRLTSLKELYITGGCLDMLSFPEEEKGMRLPTSLTTLLINEFPNLERLSSIFQELTTLKELCLCSCPKLKFFPKKGLPPSLLELEIWDCPLLQQSCENNEGLYLPMIASIPSVTINGKKVIFCRRRLLKSV